MYFLLEALLVCIFMLFSGCIILGVFGLLSWVYKKIKGEWNEREILAIVVVILIIPILYFYCILIVDGTYNLLCLLFGDEWMDYHPQFKIIWLPTPETVPE